MAWFWSKPRAPQRPARKANRLRSVRVEGLEDRAMLAGDLLISEVHFDPENSTVGDGTQYVEIFGDPNTRISRGTYLLLVDGDNDATRQYEDPGLVKSVFDLGDVQLGSNGYLSILQANHNYVVNPASAVLAGTTTGFLGIPGNRFESHNNHSDFESLTDSATYLLVQSQFRPQPLFDADINNDGVLDGNAANWTILDSLSIMGHYQDGRFVDLGYGATFFREGSNTATPPPGVTAIDVSQISYVARIGMGDGPGTWVAGLTTEQTAGGFDFVIGSSPLPRSFAGFDLNHVGAANWGIPLDGSTGGSGNSANLSISELHRDTFLSFNKLDRMQYVEIAGTPNAIIPQGTYLAVLEGEGSFNGQIKTLFNLGGVQMGANGFLVIVPAIHPYSINLGATVLQGVDGFFGIPDNRYTTTSSASIDYDIKPVGSPSFLLIESLVPPFAGMDADLNDDGELDNGAENWIFLDSISVLGHLFGGTILDEAYGQIIIRDERSAAPLPVGVPVITVGAESSDYIARVGQGYSQTDFVIGQTRVVGSGYELVPGATLPDIYGGAPLNHVGGPNIIVPGGSGSGGGGTGGGGTGGGGTGGGTGGSGGGTSGGSGGSGTFEPTDPPMFAADIVGRTNTGEWWVAESTGTSFENKYIGAWPTDVTWHDVQLADVDGDGQADLIGRDDNGDWYVSISNQYGFSLQKWGHWSHLVTWDDVQVADVNGDGLADIVGRTNGEWWVARSTGSQFVTQLWGRWSNSVTWQDVLAGDYNGDGHVDIAGRTNGDWWLARSTGSYFVTERWGHWSATVTWEDVQVADFTGDGADDLAGRTNGQWWLAKSDTDHFVTEYWGSWSNSVTWEDVGAADINGDGKADIAGRTNGEWWVSTSNNDHFVITYWGRWSNGVAWEDVSYGDFDADGDVDIAGRANGDWWLAKSTGTNFVVERWGQWSTSVSWSDVAAAVYRRPDNGGNNPAGIDLEKQIEFQRDYSASDAVIDPVAADAVFASTKINRARLLARRLS